MAPPSWAAKAPGSEAGSACGARLPTGAGRQALVAQAALGRVLLAGRLVTRVERVLATELETAMEGQAREGLAELGNAAEGGQVGDWEHGWR